MRAMLFGLAVSGLLVAGGASAAQAPQGSPGSVGQDRAATTMQQRGVSVEEGQRADSARRGYRARSEMRGSYTGHGDRHGPNMLVMMMAMMDANGDRALSLEEVQAVHERVFRYADSDGDGNLSLEELRGFFRGGAPDDIR